MEAASISKAGIHEGAARLKKQDQDIQLIHSEIMTLYLRRKHYVKYHTHAHTNL